MPHSRARLGHGPPGIPRHLGLLAPPCSSSLGYIACVPPTRSGGTDDRDTRRSGRSRPGGPLHRPDEAAPRRASLPYPSATNLLWIYPTLPTPYPLRGHVIPGPGSSDLWLTARSRLGRPRAKRSSGQDFPCPVSGISIED